MDYDCFARVHRPGPSREQVLADLAAVGLTAEADPADQRLVVIFGDRVTVVAAERLIDHMRAERVQSISRTRARAVMLGLVPREESQAQAEALADQLRQELGVGRALGADAVAVGGLVFDLGRAGELLGELKAAPPKRRAQLAGALALLGGLKPPKSRTAALQRQRRKLARVIVRSDVTAEG